MSAMVPEQPERDSAAESLSIEETNKIRISLGLKPIPIPGASATVDGAKTDTLPSTQTEEERAVANLRKLREEEQKDVDARAAKERIEKARDRMKRYEKLKGKSLGDAEEEDAMDVKRWIKRLKKKEMEMAKRRAEELEEQDEVFQRAEYTAADMAGVRVGHDVDEFAAGEGAILTLKDQGILDEEDGDELENIAMVERARLEKNLENKKKKTYVGYDDAEFEDEPGAERKILSKYDEELEGPKKRGFVLDGTAGPIETPEQRQQVIAEKLKRTVVSLDYDKPTEAGSDYAELKIKKGKKKRPKNMRQKSDEDSLLPVADPSAMEVDDAPAERVARPRRNLDDVNFIDDEDLQASLARQRRLAMKKRKILRPEDIAEQVKEATPAIEAEQEDTGGLVIDDTSEFVRGLQVPVKEERRERMVIDDPVEPPVEDVDMAEVREEEIQVKQEPTESAELTRNETTGLEEEPLVASGLGATLNMLRSKGLVARGDDEAARILEEQRKREEWLAETRKARAVAELEIKKKREADRKSGKFDRMSAREREAYGQQENRMREAAEARLEMERFKNYTPSVNLTYTDEFGRNMNEKEAFKHLSHQFHGKGSGKKKTEKRLEKIEKEKKLERVAAGDTSSALLEGVKKEGKLRLQ
ncbi:hypothetical protein YB2330_000282 [Saitoella coloradoensis]